MRNATESQQTKLRCRPPAYMRSTFENNTKQKKNIFTTYKFYMIFVSFLMVFY
jgi:hypothetical protein